MILAYVGGARSSSTLEAAWSDTHVATTGQEDLRTLLCSRAPSERTLAGARLGRAPLPHTEIGVREGTTLVLTRSGFGGRPAYLRATDDGVIASTDLGWLVRASRALDQPVTLDVDALAQRSAHLPAHAGGSIYREITEVPPGIRAEVTRSGWSLTRLPAPRAGDDEARAPAILEALTHAVAAALSSAPVGRVGVLTGGGLDSSALLAVVRKLDRDVNAFAIDFNGEDSDRPYLMALSRAHDLSPCRVSVGEERFALGADAAGLPLIWPSGALEATLLARARQWGAGVVLSGAFADACFDGDPETASRLLLRLGLRRAVAMGRAYDDASLAAGARRALIPHVRRLLSPRVRRSLHAMRGRKDGPTTRAFDGPRTRQARELAWARARDLPPAIEQDAGTRIERAFFSQELGLLSELRAQEEALSGVLRLDPYLSSELATVALSLRPEVLLGAGPRRGLFRDAVSKVLPDAIVTRAGKASFRPLHAALLARAAGSDAARFSVLADLGIVDAPAAQAAMRAGGAGHDGELLSLLGLESWLLRGGA